MAQRSCRGADCTSPGIRPRSSGPSAPSPLSEWRRQINKTLCMSLTEVSDMEQEMCMSVFLASEALEAYFAFI